MPSVHPSSLIGAQAYSVQLRRQYSQDEASRIADENAAGPVRPVKRERSAAFLNALAAKADKPSNPVLKETAQSENPAARPLYSTTQREAPNPNARLRITPPGSHLNIVV